MSERFKPGKGERYWCVSGAGEVNYVYWNSDGFDREYYKHGNCFKTEKKAQFAAKKVKALLLSLHEEQPVTECNQLPKLTAEVFNRPDCPEWAKYAAVDENGKARFHAEEPFVPTKFNGTRWCSAGNDSFISGEFDASAWQNSLVERSTKLSDWCKVGEWFYDHHQHVYDKIIAIEDGSRYCIKTKNKGFFTVDYATENLVPARLRPFNTDEMKALVGKVLSQRTYDFRGLIHYADAAGRSIQVSNFTYSSEELMEGKYTIDNKPAGVLEHLENGEWVQ